MSGVPADLYIAVYSDPNAARADREAIRGLVRHDAIAVDGLVFVARNADGKVDVEDDANDVGKGAAIGAVGGAIIGLVFPPAILGAALLGAGVGAGTGAVLDSVLKDDVEDELEDMFPPGSSGIVALVEQGSVSAVDHALARADAVRRHQVDGKSADEIKGVAAAMLAGKV